ATDRHSSPIASALAEQAQSPEMRRPCPLHALAARTGCDIQDARWYVPWPLIPACFPVPWAAVTYGVLENALSCCGLDDRSGLASPDCLKYQRGDRRTGGPRGHRQGLRDGRAQRLADEIGGL